MSVPVAAAVVSVAVLVGLAVRWWRRTAPVAIGEGIHAIARVSRGVGVTPPPSRPGVAARRRRQIRLVTSMALGALALAVVLSSHRRGLAEALLLLLLLRLAFETLAHRRLGPTHS